MAAIDRTPLEDRVALVTGGASGIGRAIARELAARGAQVAVVDIDGDGAATTASALPGAIPLACDLSDTAACALAVEHVREALGPVDILVNNAGLQHVSPIEAFPVERWRYLIDVMLVAPF